MLVIFGMTLVVLLRFFPGNMLLSVIYSFLFSLSTQTHVLLQFGTILRGLFAGFGGVNTFFVAVLDPCIGQNTIKECEFSLKGAGIEKRVMNIRNILKMISKEKRKLAKLKNNQETAETKNGDRNIFSRLIWGKDSEYNEEIKVCKTEITTLEKI